MAILKSGTSNIGEWSTLYGGGAKITKVDAYGNKLMDNSSPMYSAQINVTPTTVTANTVYWALQAGYNTTIEVIEFYLQNSFHGTTGATTSHLQILRLYNGLFTPTTVPSIWSPATAAPSKAACAQAVAGVTITNPQYETNGGIVFGVSNQIGAGVEWDMNADPRGWIITAGQGMVIRATGALVAGFTMKGFCLYRETNN